ncbi:hypothetical protein B0H19DRAFT_1202714 [Mycena capillaripes]|nr:hypothetical protein B0H19DRAFT_1202714 [Mycena capillaripes]
MRYHLQSVYFGAGIGELVRVRDCGNKDCRGWYTGANMYDGSGARPERSGRAFSAVVVW